MGRLQKRCSLFGYIYRHFRCRSGARNRTEEHTGHDTGNGQAAGKMAHKALDHIDKTLGKATLAHQRTGKDKRGKPAWGRNLGQSPLSAQLQKSEYATAPLLFGAGLLT